MRLIPAIDLKNGRCVRLLQGEFDQETVYDVDAFELARQYQAMGAGWLHVVDLDGARQGVGANRSIIGEIGALQIPALQVGGGVRDAETAAQLLEAGAARVVIGSLAVTQPTQVQQLLQRLGPDRITLAFDVRFNAAGIPMVATHGWQRQTDIALWQMIDTYGENGLIHVLCTDISRDGALAGPNLELYREAVRRFDYIDWQASGGVRDVQDLKALADTGVAAAVSGKALLERRLALMELAPFLRNE
jgi:phosphoribosylformimino-5-aminoimidazole carboxamide ribotide isomerase